MPRVFCIVGLCLLHIQAGAHVRYNLTSAPIDVVIPCSKKDLATLELSIEAIKKHGANLRRIIVVSKEPLTNQAEWFDEARYPFQKRDIAVQIFQNEVAADAYIKSSKCRLGWIYQQFLKLYAAYVIPGLSTNILILDSDTIFLRPVEFIDVDSRPLFNVGIEHHVPYFEHMQRLNPTFTKHFAEHSGITHHMLFQRPVLDDLFATIHNHSHTEPWKAICNAVSLMELFGSGLSEYEIYFNFLFNQADQGKIRPLRFLNTGDCSAIESYRQEGYDYVSCHAYLREELNQ